MYAYNFASSCDTDNDDNTCGFKRNICYIKCHEVVYSTHYFFYLMTYVVFSYEILLDALLKWVWLYEQVALPCMYYT